MTDFNSVPSNMTEEQVESGRIVNLTEFSNKASGAWPKGWYPAEVIEGYRQGGFEFVTGNKASRKGDSTNLTLCLRVTKPGETKDSDEVRTMFYQMNYRSSDFDADTQELVRNLRKEMAGVRGRWEGYEDAQRSSLALGTLGQISDATGAPVSLTEDGTVKSHLFVGTKPYIRLSIEEETGYNEVKGFSKFSNGVDPGRGKKRAKK